MNFVVLSSSHGTTFQAIIDRLKDGTITAKCLGLVSDLEDRGCVSKAMEADLPVKIIEKMPAESREEYDKRLHEAISELQRRAKRETRNEKRETIVAAIGWMYLLTPWFTSQWKNRILNVHPSLLPKYPGLHVHRDVLRASERESGMTIHLIDEGLDTGVILVQKICSVLPGDTEDTLKTRVQELEKEWYPKVLQMIEEGTMKLP